MRELTKELKLELQSYNQGQLNNAFIGACKDGDLDIVRYLLTSSELEKHADIYARDNSGFQMACLHNHLEVVRYLLTSTELKDHANIHSNEDRGFCWACNNGHLEIVRYLLTSPELQEHVNIHAYDDRGFRWACSNGHLEIVRYLLTSPELKEHANIHANSHPDEGGLWACEESQDGGFCWACEEGHLEIVCYLLTFSGIQYIDFQKTGFNLTWAICEKYDDIVKAMTLSLYKNDRFAYHENMWIIEQYCEEHSLDFQKWQEEMVKEDVDINSHTTELFV